MDVSISLVDSPMGMMINSIELSYAYIWIMDKWTILTLCLVHGGFYLNHTGLN